MMVAKERKRIGLFFEKRKALTYFGTCTFCFVITSNPANNERTLLRQMLRWATNYATHGQHTHTHTANVKTLRSHFAPLIAVEFWWRYSARLLLYLSRSLAPARCVALDVIHTINDPERKVSLIFIFSIKYKSHMIRIVIPKRLLWSHLRLFLPCKMMNVSPATSAMATATIITTKNCNLIAVWNVNVWHKIAITILGMRENGLRFVIWQQNISFQLICLNQLAN